MTRVRLLVPVGIVVVVGGVLVAQVPTSPAFEVASIKLNKSGDRASHGRIQPGGRFLFTNTTLLQLIVDAYHVAPGQVIGAPGWITSEHYDIEAKGPDNATQAQHAAMIERLVTDRFALKVHHEMRQLQAANLVMARADRRLGPHLLPASEGDSDCNVPFKVEFVNGKIVAPPCSSGFDLGVFSARGFTMERLAAEVKAIVKVPSVFNKTDLDGAFNIDELKYRPEGLSAAPPDRTGTVPSASTDYPSIYVALEEQLGLKLEMIKGPTDVIVIDQADHPTAD